MATSLKTLMLGAALATTIGPAAMAETQTENVVAEARTYVYLTVPEDVVQSVLPEGWASTPTASGPATGANVILLLVDRRLALDPEGAPLGGGTNQLAVFAVPASSANDDEGLVIVGGYAAAGAPAAYGNYEPASVTLTRSSHTEDMVTNSEEEWTISAEDGDTLSLSLSYEEATPTLSSFDQTVFSGATPDFYRMYRGSQVVDVLESATEGVDRVDQFDLSASGGIAGTLIESAEVVAVSRFAHYTRSTFVP
ncbi:hypothetical protein NO932_08350 [Pelagibacterium sp. 26DY04]|uniref:hypothetical protein n=1 Tax=Pelagibacterium sp. 26DY04 TaxID=2967130 RepID=UPI002814F904|nr:hypothetical protein [Pelagibacterium sp. 26DY04]WMT88607.1 hypothetical protein NO932_08350 [Pelagibacterium sp. 26DY04]